MQMSENQKLREALQKAKDALSLALSDVDWRKDSPTQPVIHKAYNCAQQALALPTADHLPDAGKMIETAAPVGERELFERWAKDNAIRTDLGAWDAWQARSILSLRPEKVPMTCHCHTCRPITMGDMRMVLCPKCGNKRCPHANDHRNDCTGSNEPGQPGSAYPAPHGITAKAKKE